MKKEYDFSKGTRGKFHKPDAILNLPVYLAVDVLNYIAVKAKIKGVEVNDIVNDLLRKDIDLIEGIE